MNREEKIAALKAVLNGQEKPEILYPAVPLDITIYCEEELNFLAKIKKDKKAVSECSAEEMIKLEAILKKQFQHKYPWLNKKQ